MLPMVMPHLPRFGVTRLARLTELDRIGIPIWSAIAPNARSIVVNQGKGLSDTEARLSAALEAVERSIACAPRVEVTPATRRSLAKRGHRTTILPDLVAAGGNEPDQEETIDWIKGRDLISDDQVWVPFEAVALDRTIQSCRYWQSSNGLAAGSTVEEATVHALLEVIERDAEALWKVGSLAHRCARCIDPRSFDDALLDSVCERIASADLRLRLFDVTTDMEIPCMVAIIAPQAEEYPIDLRFADVSQGNGAHPSPYRAALNAVIEAVQSRLTYISGARDDILPGAFRKGLPSDTAALLEALPRMIDARNTAVSYSDPGQLLVRLLECLEKIEGRSAIVVPLTMEEEFPFEVVKILVDGLEHPDGARKKRFGPRAISRNLCTG